MKMFDLPKPTCIFQSEIGRPPVYRHAERVIGCANRQLCRKAVLERVVKRRHYPTSASYRTFASRA
jgi:hypothetical protein